MQGQKRPPDIWGGYSQKAAQALWRTNKAARLYARYDTRFAQWRRRATEAHRRRMMIYALEERAKGYYCDGRTDWSTD